MTRTRSLFLLALLLTACTEGGTAPPETSSEAAQETPEPEPPKSWFEFERDTEDFGDVYASAIRETTFDMVVAGEEGIVLDELRRTCGCTEGELYVLGDAGEKTLFEVGRSYPPGTRFELLAKLNTKGKQGTQEQRVHIDVRGHELPTSFTLKAEIVTFFVFEPPSLQVKNASVLTGAGGAFVVTSRKEEKFGVDVRREILPPEIEVDFDPIEPDAEGRATSWNMTFRILPGVPKGPFKRKLILLTDVENPEADELPDGSRPQHAGELWIRADIQGVFDVRPERLNFGRLAAGKNIVKKIVVRSRDPEFSFSGLEVGLWDNSGTRLANTDTYELSTREIDPGKAWEVEVRVLGSPESGEFGGLLGIRTFHALEPEVHITFVGQAAAVGSPTPN